MILLESKVRKILNYFLNILIFFMIFLLITNSYIQFDQYLKTKREINYQNTLFEKYKVESLKQKKDLKEFFDFLENDLNSYLIEFDYTYPLSPNATVLIVTGENSEFKTKYDFDIVSNFSLENSQIAILNIRGD
ncbi:hypothetical protein [Geotoga petraea]|jgi:hypothetical protein|uniref:Sensor histidine kinase n=1 Tax=Geotoga petraea TaxID=28234 RepID=A0A1G6PBU7_9BACT|nr:hypothetical protein [Geotoga petraea]MDK2946713.1 hypothetical protein [Geotoga sp.]TGG87949.1 hypothetical protein E4650_06300 [Geotoga petraea]SDC76785.1 hypothetical protein SAMN04488588_1767 [Geotoga petraea]